MGNDNKKGKRMEPYRVLIIEDQPEIIEYCSQFIKNGFIYNAINTGKEIENVLKCSDYDLVLLDKDFSHISKDLLLGPPSRASVEGLEILKKIRSFDINMPVIMITGFGDYDSVSTAFRLGVFDYIESEILTKDELILKRKMENAISKHPGSSEELIKKYDQAGLIGKSKSMIDVFKQIEKILKINCNVLLLGETGVGKDEVARVIHRLSDRSSGPLIMSDMTQRELFETSQFGQRKGAFTDAKSDRKGLFELADGGYLFLNEIGELSIEIQSRLLTAIENKEFYPFGSENLVKFDARIIAATNRDLDKALKDGTFRQDLYSRLSQMKLVIPPLSKRKEDISLLAKHFVEYYCRKFELSSIEVTDKAIRYLEERAWPGNVRELRNAIRELVGGCEGIISIKEVVEIDTNRSNSYKTDPVESELEPYLRDKTLEDLQRDLVIYNLKRFAGNVKLAADAMKIGKTTMYDLIKKYNLKRLESNSISMSE